MEKAARTKGLEEVPLHCPLCGREIKGQKQVQGGWNCKCGEFVPTALVVDPFEGCTHGRGCNCGRERRQ